MSEVPAAVRESIAREWLARVLASYPAQTARFLLTEKNRFHNPVGYALSNGLPVLVDELLGEMNPARIRPVLEEIVRMRAVQDFTASQAVAFIFELRAVAEACLSENLDDRIDRLALEAFDLYAACRERMHEIKIQEARRRVYVLERGVT